MAAEDFHTYYAYEDYTLKRQIKARFHVKVTTQFNKSMVYCTARQCCPIRQNLLSAL